MPSCALAAAGKARFRQRDHIVSQPKPSRALAPAGKARLRHRGHSEVSDP